MSSEGQRRQLRRRTLLEAGAGALVGGLGLGAAQAFWPERDAEDTAPEALRGRPLRVLTGRDDTANGQRGLLVDAWNSLHRSLPAELVELPGVADLQYSAIHAALQSGDEGVDVVNLDLPWIAGFAAEGWLRPLDGVEESGFLAPPLEAGRFGGDLYALPFNTDVGMLYYRSGDATDPASGTVAPEDAARLRDWAALRSLAVEVLGAGGAFEGGVAMQLAPYEGFTVNVWEYLLANGVPVDAADGRIDFGAPIARLALESLVDELHVDAGGGRTVVLSAALQHTEDDAMAAFQSGAVPFLRHWPRAYQVLRSCEADLGFAVGAVPMPGAVLGGQSLAVSAASSRPNASRMLIEFLTGHESQEALFTEGGFAATREEPYFDAIAQAAAPGAREAACEEVLGPRPDAELLYGALTGLDGEGRADPDRPPPGTRPAVERYTRFSRAFQEYLHTKLDSEAKPDLGDMPEVLDAAIAGA